MESSVTDVTFTNSILYGQIITTANPAVFTDNVYYSTSGLILSLSSPTNIHADPLFVNMGGNDFALQGGSPAAGRGSRVTSVAMLFALFPDHGPGFFQFSSDGYSTSEAAGTASVTVRRMGAGDGAVSVHYATSNGTALDGVNYHAVSGTLNWADGDMAEKTFSVPLINAGTTGSITVNLALSGPAGGAILETPNSAVLTITASAATPTPSVSCTPGLVAAGDLGIFPNPAEDQVTFQFPANAAGQATLEFYNTAGKLISRIRQDIGSVQSRVVWSCRGAAAGLYFVKVFLKNTQGQESVYPVRKIAVTRNKSR